MAYDGEYDASTEWGRCMAKGNHPTSVVMACSPIAYLTGQSCRRCECGSYGTHAKGCTAEPRP